MTADDLFQIQPLTEVVTIAASGTSFSGIAIPVNAVVFGVLVRVIVAIPTATTFSVGVADAITRYGTGISVAAFTPHHDTNDAPRFYGASTIIHITPSATPATNAGRVRLSIFYIPNCLPVIRAKMVAALTAVQQARLRHLLG